MKKVKIAIWVVILGFLALVIFQNQDFFLADQSLQIDLWVVSAYNSPSMPVAVIFLLFFAAGLLIAYLFTLPDRFRSKREMKRLSAAQADQADQPSGRTKEKSTGEKDSSKLKEDTTKKLPDQPAESTAKIETDIPDDNSRDPSQEKSHNKA